MRESQNVEETNAMLANRLGRSPTSRKRSNWNLFVLDSPIASTVLWPEIPSITSWFYVTHTHTPSPDRSLLPSE